MKKIILGLITVLTINLLYGQQFEKLDYCNCQDKIDQINPDLNGKFERRCNGILIEMGEFIAGLKNGEWITYSRKGKLIRILNYDNGLLNGKVELYYINGKPKMTGEFEKGNKIGKWTYYTEKGKILCEGSYVSNAPVGTWTINDNKGKNLVAQYDFNSNKYLINYPTPFLKDMQTIQNENTEEWYILGFPSIKFSSKTEPLGGYEFANYMFIELVEVPEIFWDTYLYNKYKISFNVTSKNEVSFDCNLSSEKKAEAYNEFTFLINTDPAFKLKQIEHSDLELKLLDLKIKEAINLMPPWIYNGDSEVEIFLHYVINQNMH